MIKKDYVTTAEAVSITGLPEWKLRAMVAEGLIQTTIRTKGGHRRYLRSDLENAPKEGDKSINARLWMLDSRYERLTLQADYFHKVIAEMYGTICRLEERLMQEDAK